MNKRFAFACDNRWFLAILLVVLVCNIGGNSVWAQSRVVDPTDPNQSLPPVIVGLGQWELISTFLPDGSRVATYSGGIWVGQRRNQDGSLLSLSAENAVVFFAGDPIMDSTASRPSDPNRTAMQRLGDVVSGVYLEGDVSMSITGLRAEMPGEYRITAEKVYYDFTGQRALVIDATMRIATDPALPFYLRAARIRQVSMNEFLIEKLKLSNDEFYQPHVWLGARQAGLSAVDVDGEAPQSLNQVDHYGFDLEDVTINLGEVPVFYWPRLAGSTVKTDAPIKSFGTSYSSRYGGVLETEWHLASLLGLAQPKGVESVLRVDEFTKHGPGGGIDLDYTQDLYRGLFRSYVIDDHGEDRLGKYGPRHDIEPSQTLRGRTHWQHRQYLPYDWQGTVEISYLSDPTFLENWEEKEFDTEKEQETLVYLKQQRDNWAFDFTSKWHLNEFDYTMTELPTAGIHVAGQDIFETFTYYHDGYVSRVSERAGDRQVSGMQEDLESWLLPDVLDERDYAFAVSRHELALPIHLGSFSFVPTVIGTYVYDDTAEENSFFQGAGGFRASTQFHHIDRTVQSRMFDLDEIRHIVTPEVSVFWTDSDLTEEAHQDIFNFTLRQRWQTKRGPAGNKRSVDVFRLDAGVTLVDPEVSDTELPNKFFFSTPEPQYGMMPLENADFYNLGLSRRRQINQNLASHTTVDWTWMISDTTAYLGGFNYNMNDGDISEAHSSIAVQRIGRTSYYVGHMYLHDADRFRDMDAQFLTGGMSYRLNSKYSIALGHQFDIERGVDAHTQLVIVRQFPHWFGAFSLNIDPSKDQYSLSVTFWPAGYDKIALGSRRFTRLGW